MGDNDTYKLTTLTRFRIGDYRWMESSIACLQFHDSVSEIINVDCSW